MTLNFSTSGCCCWGSRSLGAGGKQRQRAGGCEGAMQSLLAGRLPFRIVVMIVVDMISIGLTPSNRIMSILPSSAGADGGLSW